MGVYANTVSIMHYTILGELPEKNQFEWFSTKLSHKGFQSIESSAEETSEGWVQVDRPDEITFETPADFWRDDYLLFTLRRDQRKVPAAVLKSHISREEGAFLAQNPNLRRTPKNKREEIKELIQQRLLTRCLPVPSTVDIVWNQKNGILTLYSVGSNVIERFEDLFRKSFEGFTPIVIHPYARAKRLLSGDLLKNLEKANQANSDAVAALIRDNQWIGWEFLLWLLHRGICGEGEYNVNQNGHLAQGERFSAWIDEKIQLQGGGEEGGVQKVTVSGSQDSYLEAISALRGGKRITSATIYLEKDENLWKLTLKGENFAISSFKCPQVRVEKDATVEEMSEREAVFYERMFLTEQGLQMFDSLFSSFLTERLGADWNSRLKTIQEWLDGNGAA